jgi:PHD/YefM family antitoxin component YafN of YafNO toxin-antitoxin module
MKTVTLSKASRSLAQYATELEDEVVIVTDGDQPLAALIPLRNVDRESLMLSTHPEFMKIVQQSRSEFDAGKTLSLEEMSSRVRRMRPPRKRSQPTAATRARRTTRKSRSRRD